MRWQAAPPLPSPSLPDQFVLGSGMFLVECACFWSWSQSWSRSCFRFVFGLSAPSALQRRPVRSIDRSVLPYSGIRPKTALPPFPLRAIFGAVRASSPEIASGGAPHL